MENKVGGLQERQPRGGRKLIVDRKADEKLEEGDRDAVIVLRKLVGNFTMKN